ncbi:Uncharacterised protein [uncultured archaeon]|nr:Uncharacterised protein [uncultured archaeon]
MLERFDRETLLTIIGFIGVIILLASLAIQY